MQTFTIVGYGQDAPWEHPLINVLVIGMQAGSLLLIFTAFPADRPATPGVAGDDPIGRPPTSPSASGPAVP